MNAVHVQNRRRCVGKIDVVIGVRRHCVRAGAAPNVHEIKYDAGVWRGLNRELVANLEILGDFALPPKIANFIP